MKVTLHLADGKLSGTFENASEEALENVAVVLGSSVAVLGDVGPHASTDVSLSVRDNPFGNSLADQVIGQQFEGPNPDSIQRSIRYQMVNQLTYDPTGMFTNSLSSDQAVVMAFGKRQLLDVQLGSQVARQNGNVLYYVPVAIGVQGHVAFSTDLMRATVIQSDAQLFSKDRFFLSLGSGSATMSYRPIPFEGSFTPSAVRFAITSGGGLGALGNGEVIEPLPSIPVVCTDSNNTIPKGCRARREDFLPEVEVFDRSGAGAWVRLPRMRSDAAYSLADPTRYVDATGQILVRFVNENPQLEAGFGFQLVVEGDIK